MTRLLDKGRGSSGKGGTLGCVGDGTRAGICAVGDDLGCLAELGESPDAGLLSKRFLVPPLNIALTSSQAWTTSSGGFPDSFMCRRHELKLAASGWTYLSDGPIRCEWKMNLFGEKKRPQYAHLMHLARELLYRAGRNAPRHPQAHSW